MPMTPDSFGSRRMQLGLRENWRQFSLLVLAWSTWSVLAPHRRVLAVTPLARVSPPLARAL
ncbi:MAG TPA: hypothetical protein VNH44_13925 [Micropepsaceae bacterium]|nr:hypothetical protein [Micropepsaceae bacterium]